MVHSMTAFARQTLKCEQGSLTLELRSVNHRYCEIGMRLPDDLRHIEPKIREYIGRVVHRGKLDCTFRYHPPEMQDGNAAIDNELLRVLIDAAKQVEKQLGESTPMRASDFLRWPGVLKHPEQDMSELGASGLKLLESALEDIVATRQREGEQLRKVIEVRCDSLENQLADLQKRLPEVLKAMRTRLMDRLEVLKSNVDMDRLEQEMLILANRSDISEEIDRLNTHIIEVRRVLGQDQPIGRRLDFLMQELNREANTVGSKSADSQTTKIAVELKVLIEQIREQVQNIE